MRNVSRAVLRAHARGDTRQVIALISFADRTLLTIRTLFITRSTSSRAHDSTLQSDVRLCSDRAQLSCSEESSAVSMDQGGMYLLLQQYFRVK